MSNQYRPTDRSSRAWLHANRAALLELGFPLSILGNERNWRLFLEDGAFSSAVGGAADIDVDAMPEAQASRVLAFLVAHYPNRSGAGVSPYRAVNRLEAILRRGPHAVGTSLEQTREG